MKRYWVVLLVIAVSSAATCQERSNRKTEAGTSAEPALVSVSLDSQTVTVLHLRPGYVSSVRMPEEISSVVLGDPNNFKAEHSESEPRLVFIKPLSSRATETNLLITTASSRSVSLHLINDLKRSSTGQVDFVLTYEIPRSLVVQPTVSSFFIPDSSENVASASSDSISKPDLLADELKRQSSVTKPNWEGNQDLHLSFGRVTALSGQDMLLTFSILNSSAETIELLPPQLILSQAMSGDRKQKTKAEPLGIEDFKIQPGRRLGPGARADGVVKFERPTFKESKESLLLQIAPADKVDRPVQVVIPFTTPYGGTAQ